MSELFDSLIYGFGVALSLQNLTYCFIGVTLGTFVGVLPGIGALAAISMLLPITFYLPPTAALVMLAGVYYGGEYGGSISSILLNLPGNTANAITCLDGYPMARQGRAAVALFLTTIASFVGGTLAILLLMLVAPAIVEFALAFQSPEYFAVMLVGLVAAGTIAQGAPLRGLAMVCLGLLLSSVGTDNNSGAIRFDLGLLELSDGIGIIPLAMGLFGISEVVSSINANVHRTTSTSITMRAMMPTAADIRTSILPTLRGTGIGSFFGALPGTGPTIASLISYAVEKRIARDPSRFGKGAIEGITSPEAANNAAAQTAFIPTLTLGIPATPTMAVMMGALMIHGVQPGPNMMTRHPDVFWGLVASFWIGNVMLLVLNIPLIGIWVRMLDIPYKVLYPTIIAIICIGAYSIDQSSFDVLLVFVFGFFGYGMRRLGFEPAPLLIGFVLGRLIEENFRRSLMLGKGDFLSIVHRPISGSLIVVAVALLGWLIWSHRRRHQRLLAAAAPGPTTGGND